MLCIGHHRVEAAVQYGEGQEMLLTVEKAISLAQSHSISSMVAHNTFLSKYWTFRAHKAALLPSLNLRGEVGSLNRSILPLQDANTGQIFYRNNFNMNNNAAISINQNVAATGGQLSVYSSLSRLDQYKPFRDITYYSQPITLSYIQPLWSFNRLKWDKKLEPQRYEASKREYLESMEDVTLQAVRLFFGVAMEEINLDIAKNNYANTKANYDIAAKRFELGTIKQNDLMQLELRMLNDSIAINSAQLQLSSQVLSLRSFLGYDGSTNLKPVIDTEIPLLQLDYDQVLSKAMQNSSFAISQIIENIEAEMGISQAKANRGMSAEIRTRFGLSNSSDEFAGAYRGLLDEEIVGFTFSIPIMDWGMGKGRVKVAQAQAETARNRIEQAIIDYRQEIYTEVMRFNNQRAQCQISQRASIVAEERYQLSLDNFAGNNISVTELNVSQSEKDEARRRYISELTNYWIYYFQLRRKSLYDYISGSDISAEFDKMVE